MAKSVLVVSRATLIKEAAALQSEHRENREYDRALAELIYWTAGGKSPKGVEAEIQAEVAVQAQALGRVLRSYRARKRGRK